MSTNLLSVNWIILYFVYGQVFFIMGLVTGLKWQRRSQFELARSLPWLVVFGITHGLNEWGYIFVPLQALSLSPATTRLLVLGHLLLLAVSFFFLLLFGTELVLPKDRRYRGLRYFPLLMLIIWGMLMLIRGVAVQESLSQLLVIGDGWSRYLLAFPGASLATVGFLKQAERARESGMQKISLFLRGAAISFAVYAVVGGLIVPTAPVFPSNLLNYALLDSLVGIPAPVFRSICGLAMAIFVVRSLDIFHAETERRIEQMEHERLLAMDRERIGRDLHDGIIQNIYAAGLSLQDIQHTMTDNPPIAEQRLRGVVSRLDQIIADIRSYIFNLHTAHQSREFLAVIEELVNEIRLDTLLEVEFEVHGPPCCHLTAEQVAHLAQTAREALSNVVQHSEARHVAVIINYSEEGVGMTISDDGKGFDSTAMQNGHTGLGIENMRERSRLMGGDLELISAPNRGLTLTVTIPCGGEK